MNIVLKTGLAAECQFTVDAADVIDFKKPGLAPVLSTPALIGHLEHTAIRALEPVLSADQISLGAEIEVQHLVPTTAGSTVTCTARVVHVEGPRATFQLEARRGAEVLARGVHQRVVVRVDSLARRLAGSES